MKPRCGAPLGEWRKCFSVVLSGKRCRKHRDLTTEELPTLDAITRTAADDVRVSAFEQIAELVNGDGHCLSIVAKIKRVIAAVRSSTEVKPRRR